MRRGMKLRLLVLLLWLSVLACCSDQVQRLSEPSTVMPGSLCMLYIQQPLKMVEFASFECKETHFEGKESNSVPIDSALYSRYGKSFWDNHKVGFPYGQVAETNGPKVAPSPEPSTDVNEHEYAGVAYLTFDDGPGKFTGEVLDILAVNDIPATFFVLGQQVERYPEIVQRIADEGHSIGNHSYNHVYDELYNDFTNFSAQVFQTSQAIYEVTGIQTPLLRAPGGTYRNIDTSYYDAISEAGFIMFDWNVDSGDSAGRNVTAETIVNNVKEANLMKRVIVLMHDSNSHEATIAALPEIIAYYREQNYRFDMITATTDPMVSKITDNIRWKRAAATEQEKTEFKQQVNELMSQ